MLSTSEVLFIAVIFFATYWLTDPKKKGQQQADRRERGLAMEMQLHQLRVSGVNMDKIFEMAAELIRRGVPMEKIPTMNGSDMNSLYELQARLQLMIEETPYVHRELQEPGEDRTLAKSSFQLWPRGLEQDNGDI